MGRSTWPPYSRLSVGWLSRRQRMFARRDRGFDISRCCWRRQHNKKRAPEGALGHLVFSEVLLGFDHQGFTLRADLKHDQDGVLIRAVVCSSHNFSGSFVKNLTGLIGLRTVFRLRG